MVIMQARHADQKKIPSLVLYSELAESEKDYDRNTAIETLKLIVKLGYTLERVSG